MTDQNDQPTESLSGQIVSLARHYPLTGIILSPKGN